jgi:hypothetical protein
LSVNLCKALQTNVTTTVSIRFSLARERKSLYSQDRCFSSTFVLQQCEAEGAILCSFNVLEWRFGPRSDSRFAITILGLSGTVCFLSRCCLVTRMSIPSCMFHSSRSYPFTGASGLVECYRCYWAWKQASTVLQWSSNALGSIKVVELPFHFNVETFPPKRLPPP